MTMTSLKFPFTYFVSIFSPKKIFGNRGHYKWRHVFIIVIFLNSLILVPVTMNYAKQKTYSLEMIVPNGLSAITKENFHLLQGGKIEDGEYQGQSVVFEEKNTVIAVLPSESELQKLARLKKTVLIISRYQWRFLYPNGNELTAQMKGDYDLSSLASLSDVKHFVNQQWLNSNRALVLVYILGIYISLIYAGSFLILVIGGFFLSLSKKSEFFSIKSYKEGVGLMLNCFGLPTLFSVVMSIVLIDPITIMNIQILGSLLMLVFVFYKTHFKD